MEEKSIFSPGISRDITERLQTNTPDEATLQKNYKMMEDIASKFHIGQKFKVPQIELFYHLCTNNPIELQRNTKKLEKFAPLFDNIKEDDEEKNILCRIANNYLLKQLPIDKDDKILDKIIETYPLVSELAQPDKTHINIFYNTHRESDVDFSRNEIINKFYSYDYGVVVTNMGQVKTPIFYPRNYKSPDDECKRMDILAQALQELPPAKFMLFALHFDKYLEKLPNIDDDLAVGAIKNVVPLIKSGKNKILNSVGNIWGTDITDHGSSGFIFRCLTSRVTPYNITRLCRIAEQIPSSDDNRFEQIRLDAISIDNPWPNLRSYIHNQQPEQHKLLKRMALYHDSVMGVGEKLDPAVRTEKLKEIIDYITLNSPSYNLKNEDLFNINKYQQDVYDSGGNKVKVIDIIQRMRHNTTPRTLEVPQINDAYTKHLLEEIVDTNYPFHKHNTYGEYLQKLNNHLERKMKAGAIGIKPKTINSILWSERRGFQVLEAMDAGYQLSAYKYPWFKETLRFYELTNSAEDSPKSDINKFINSLQDKEMEEAYCDISMRISDNIVKLSKRQREDSNEYLEYITNLNISEKQKNQLQKKISESLKLKISRNMSGYGMANAFYNCMTPRRTPYKALERFMKNRRYR